jgi:hypothetical protein
VVSEPIPGLERLPVLRVPDECAYYKEDAGKIMIGAFEPVAKPWGMAGIPESFEFDELPFDMEHMEPVLAKAIERVPLLAEAGFRTLFNGPESFTPDDRYYLGEAPELRGYWVAAGYNSIGIVSSGGAGMALAQWMEDGEPPFDLWEVDIRRAQPFQENRRYLVHWAARHAPSAATLTVQDHGTLDQGSSTAPLRVFTFSPDWGLPTNGPSALKLLAWLELTGIPYDQVVENNSSKGLKGKSPWAEIDGKPMADSELIIDSLSRRHGIDLVEGHSPDQRRLGLAWRRTFEEHLHQVLEWELLIHPAGAA